MYEKLQQKMYQKLLIIFFVKFALIVCLAFALFYILVFLFDSQIRITMAWFVSFVVSFFLMYKLHFNYYFKKYLKKIINDEIKKYQQIQMQTTDDLLELLHTDRVEAGKNVRKVFKGEDVPKDCYEKRDKQIIRLHYQEVRFGKKELFFISFYQRYCMESKKDELVHFV